MASSSAAMEATVGDRVTGEADLIRATLMAAREVTGADNATLAVPDAEPGYVRVVASAAGDPGNLWHSRFALRDGVAGEVAATGQAVLLGEASRSPRFRQLGARPIESILAVPIELGAGSRGILTVTAAQPHAFGPEALTRLAALARPLEATLGLAEQANWGSQIAALAHDLNTPLSSIRGFLALVGEESADMPPEQLRQYLQLAALATEQLVHLVGDMRDVLSLAQRKLHLRLAPVDPATLVRAAVELLAPLVAEADVQLICRLHPDLLPIVADRRRLERVLSNLIQNALKYTPAGGRVWVTAEPGETGVRLIVEDEGPGSVPAPRPVAGHGLGLAIAHALTAAHGGVLAAANRPGGGARFTIDLPHQPAPEPPAM